MTGLFERSSEMFFSREFTAAAMVVTKRGPPKRTCALELSDYFVDVPVPVLFLAPVPLAAPADELTSPFSHA